MAADEKMKKMLDARAKSKFFGGKALKGSSKQVAWGEQIRAKYLSVVDMDAAIAACDPSGLLTDAHWWIEHRNANPADIADFVKRQKSLLDIARCARESRDEETYSRIADEYNALTARWGL